MFFILFIVLLASAQATRTYNLSRVLLSQGPFVPAPQIAATSAWPLIHHGGREQPILNMYMIYMGSHDPATPRTLRALVTNIDKSPYMRTMRQYVTATDAPPRVFFRKAFFPDEMINVECYEAGGRTAANFARVKELVCGLREVNLYDTYAWITTEQRPPECQACGWHDTLFCQGKEIQIIYVFNAGPGCAVSTIVPPNLLHLPDPVATVANVLVHEIMEVQTDPDSQALFDARGLEVADKCAWQGLSTPTMIRGKPYNLQTMWSNSASACVRGTSASCPLEQRCGSSGVCAYKGYCCPTKQAPVMCRDEAKQLYCCAKTGSGRVCCPGGQCSADGFSCPWGSIPRQSVSAR